MATKTNQAIKSQLYFPFPDGDSTVMFFREYRHANDGRGRWYTICVIHTPKQLVTATAICHPGERNNDLVGAKVAFGKALKQMFPNWTMPMINDREAWGKYDERNRNRETRRTLWGFFLKSIQEGL